MAEWEVRMGTAGGGSGTFIIVVHAASPEGAKRAAEAQNPGYTAQYAKRLH